MIDAGEDNQKKKVLHFISIIIDENFFKVNAMKLCLLDEINCLYRPEYVLFNLGS